MNRPSRKLDHATRRRRYLVHLSLVRDASDDSRQYVLCIQPWTSRRKKCSEATKRLYSDECALIEVVNPLLPCGSDVRDVLEHIESNGGFFYLLRLTAEEAHRLGWQS